MIGRADKGLIITTGRFTSEAQREAVRDEFAPAIDLVDGDTLCELLKNLRLGVEVRSVEVVEIRALLDNGRKKYAEFERAGRAYWFGPGDSAGEQVFRKEAYCRILQKHHAEDLVAKNYSKYNPAQSPVFPKLDPAN